MNDAQSGSPAADLHKVLMREIRNLRTADEWKRWLGVAAVFHQYSFRNAVLIAMQMPQATSVAGWSTWKKLGRHVMKGEKAIKILAPIFSRSQKAQNEAKEASTWVIHELADASAGSVPKGSRLVGFRVTNVWDVSQTAGEPLPRPPGVGPVVGSAPAGLWDKLADQVKAYGFHLSVEPTRMVGTEGYTDHLAGRVVVSDSLDEVTAVARLAHEVAHMMLHSPEEIEAAGSVMCRGMREVEAESVAFVLLAHHGLRTDGSSFPYVTGWAATVDKDEPERVVQRTGQRVMVVAHKLIEATSVQFEPDEPGPLPWPARSVVRTVEATTVSLDTTSPGI